MNLIIRLCLFVELAGVGYSRQTYVVVKFIRPIKIVVLHMGMEIDVSKYERVTDICGKWFRPFSFEQ